VLVITLRAGEKYYVRRRTALPHDNWVWTVAYSPDGKFCATASKDNTARIWDAITGQPVSEPLRHDKPVWILVFSPDGKKLLTGSGDDKTHQGQIRLWDVPSGKPLAVVAPNLPLSRRLASKLALSPDGRSLLVVASGQAEIWKLSAD